MWRVSYIFLFLSFISLHAHVALNEVMSNVKGNESGIGAPGDRNEFIELYNAGPDSVDMTKMMISDSRAIDEIIIWPDSVPLQGGLRGNMLPPGYFALILDLEYTMTGDSMYVMPYSIPDNAFVYTIGNTSLGDNGLSSTEYVMLIDSDSNIIDTYGTPDIDDAFPYDPGDGISMERLNPLFTDAPASWAPCSSMTGNTAGYRNSCYCNGSIIDSFSVEFDRDSAAVTVSLISDSLGMDTLQVITEDNIRHIPVSSNTIVFKAEASAFINICTMHSDTYSILCSDSRLNGPVIYNEFMVSGTEWVELYNVHSIDAYLNECMLINNDTTIICGLSIPADSFVIICKDSSAFTAEYGHYQMNVHQAELFPQPDREDTFMLIWQSHMLDSVIRGYEGTYCSIERINPALKGYEPGTWGNSIDIYRATPCRVNSLFTPAPSENRGMSINTAHLNTDNPLLMLSTDFPYVSGTLNVYILNEMGQIIDRPVMDRLITGQSMIPVKPALNKMKTGLYIMYIDIIFAESHETGRFIISFTQCN